MRLISDDVLGAHREAGTATIEPYHHAFSEISKDPNNRVYVAEVDGAVVGCYQLTLIANLSFEGGRRALIEGVHVDAAWRNQGIGRQLMDHAVKISQAENCRIVQLTSNKQREDALRFYERLGFLPTHVGFKLYL